MSRPPAAASDAVGHRTRRERAGLLAGIAGAVVYAWFASRPRPFSVAANVFVLLPGCAVAAWALAQRRPAGALPDVLRRRPDRAGALRTALRRARAWCGLGTLIVALELTELFSAPRVDHPTVSALVHPAFATHPGRFVLFGAWLAFGAFLVTR